MVIGFSGFAEYRARIGYPSVVIWETDIGEKYISSGRFKSDMDYLNHPDYTCTESSDGNVYCEHSPEASRLGRIVRDCNRGREKLSPVAQTSEAMESHTPVDIPPGPVEVAELSEEIDPTQQMVKFAGCAAMVGREALRSGSDMWYLNLDSTDHN